MHLVFKNKTNTKSMHICILLFHISGPTNQLEGVTNTQIMPYKHPNFASSLNNETHKHTLLAMQAIRIISELTVTFNNALD